MKKSLLALAALGAFASAAQAQSSVTLYGLIDTGVNYVTNVQTIDGDGNRIGKSQLNLSSGVMQGSRWGLRGTEDLGDGLKAVFTLENGFDVNTGAQGQGFNYFGRQAFVGLAGDFGAVTIGRQYDSVAEYVGPLAAGGRTGGTFAAHPGDLDNFNSSQRVNNAIKYTSANYDGLTFSGLYSLGGQAGHFGRDQIWSAGVGYANGPLSFGAAYLNAKNPNDSFYGNNPFNQLQAQNRPGINNLGNATFVAGQINPNPVYAGYASARTLQVIGAGGTYSFGPLTAGLTYSNTRFIKLGDAVSPNDTPQQAQLNPSNFTGTAMFHNAEASLAYQFSPALVGIAAYDYTRSNKLTGTGPGAKDTFTTGAKYHQVSLGAAYSLSKRTSVYVLGAYQKARGIDSTGQKAVAAINGLTPSNKNTEGVLRVGMTHAF